MVVKISCVQIVTSMGKHAQTLIESSGGIVVRALAFHQCGPGSISSLGVTCGLSLLVLFSTLRGFSQGTLVFPSPPKTCI